MEFSPSGRGFAFTWLHWTKHGIINYQSFIWYVPKMWNELRDCVIHSMTTGIFKTTPSDISMGKNTTAFRPEYPKLDQILRAFHGCFIWESSQERSGPRPLKRQRKSPVNFWWKKTKVWRMRWKSRVKVSPLYPIWKGRKCSSSRVGRINLKFWPHALYHY